MVFAFNLFNNLKYLNNISCKQYCICVYVYVFLPLSLIGKLKIIVLKLTSLMRIAEC